MWFSSRVIVIEGSLQHTADGTLPVIIKLVLHETQYQAKDVKLLAQAYEQRRSREQ